MRRILVAAALAAAVAALGAPTPASADSYCFRSGLTIMGEPWLNHEQCVPCPTVDCPDPPAQNR